MERTRSFAVDGVELAWDEWGRGRPLVLCHGFMGSGHDFGLHIDALAVRQRVVALDHRGHGHSTNLGALEGYSLARLAADLIALIEDAATEPVDLLGHSMGGRVALEVVLDRPDLVRSLVLMDTSAWSFDPDDEERSALMRGFLLAYDPADGLPDVTALPNPEDALIAAATPVEWQQRKLEEAARVDPYAFKALGTELLLNPVSVRERLGEIACPVTVIVGQHDEPFAGQAPALAAEVADGRLTVIPAAYHSPQLTEQDAWRRAVEAHLER